MKKVLLAFFTVVTTLASVSASLDPYDIVVRADPTSGTLVVRTTVPASATAEVEILNGDGFTVFSNTLPAGHYLNRRFPSASLKRGTYRLVIQDDLGRTEQPFLVGRDGIEQDVTKARRILYPRVELQATRLLVIDYDNEKGRSVNIVLADHAGETLFEEKVDGTEIRRTYQLDQLDAGNYYVTVSGRNVKKYTTAIALH